MNTNYDIQNIESALATFLKSTGLTQPIYEGQRPNSKVSMASFLVVSVPSTVTDLNALGRCTARIEIFVKNDSSGLKQGKVFSNIYKKIFNHFPIKHDKYLFDNHPSLIALGNDSDGYHVQALNINTLIKAI